MVEVGRRKNKMGERDVTEQLGWGSTPFLRAHSGMASKTAASLTALYRVG